MGNSKKLENYISELESYIPKHQIANTKVSKSTIGWQIDHSLKVINNVSIAVQNSDPNSYKNNMSLLGKFFLALGKFPRGKAKAPKHVRPPEVITKDDLISQVQLAKNNIQAIDKLPELAYFKHPMFGNIKTKKVNRFLEVHTKHHLKIIRDMLNIRHK